jgi:uncharacterized protein YndB with AHSA1/START domain
MKETFVTQQRRVVDAPPIEVFRVVTGLGGKRGWLAFNWAWQLRGMIDTLVGGVGLRRGRRHPDDLRVGDEVDFWRVDTLEPNRLLRLYAEMVAPGQGWLQFEIEPQGNNRCRLTQTAYFTPNGLSGYLYWYVLLPIHRVIFSTLIHRAAERAENNHKSATL